MVPFNWQTLSRYSFWVALICIVIVITSVFADEALRKLLVVLFATPPWAKSLFFAVLTVSFWLLGSKKNLAPEDA